MAGLIVGLTAATLSAQTSRTDRSHNAPGPTPIVRRLVLRGVRHVDPDDLRKSIATQDSRCKSLLLTPFCLVSGSPTFVERHRLDREDLRRDVLRLRVYYWKRGYRDAQVDTTVSADRDGKVVVTFDVTEGEPTRLATLRIEYDSTLLSDKRFRKLVLLRAGDPLNLVTLDSMRVLFQEEMWERGYADARVDTAVVVRRETRSADVLLRVLPNWKTTVGTITVRGNAHVNPKTILNTITLRRGDVFRRSAMLESQRNLYESNLFRLATILPPTGDSVKQLDIQVLEAPLRATEVGFGINTVDFTQVQVRHTNFNLLGGARRLDVTASAGNLLAPALSGQSIFRNAVGDIDEPGERARFLQPTWTASVDLKQPSFLRHPSMSFGVGAFAHRRSLPGVYIDRGYGGTTTLTNLVRARAPASLNYRYEVTRVEASDVYFCVNYGVCDTLTIGSLRAHQSMSPLALTGFVDRSDNSLNPTRGYLLRLDLEHASSVTLSDYRYNRGFLDLATYWHPSGRKLVLASHLRLGAVRPMTSGRLEAGSTNGVLHPRKRFYAGGSQSVRGYAENQLGPRILTLDPALLATQKVTTRAGGACDAALVRTAQVRFCDPNTGGLRDRDFDPRPLGGTSVVEGSVEVRVPLLERYNLDGAVFVDGAVLGESALQKVEDIRALARGTGAITPGFGVRYRSPVGPIRIDIGIDPKITEDLTVVTEITENGKRRIVPLLTPRHYSPASRGGWLSRLTLHFSIGQAY